MTDQELAANLETADTELAAIDAKILECIAGARVHNRQRRALEEQRDSLRANVQPLREEAARRMQEAKRQQAEKAKADAEAKAKEPQPPSQLELLAAEVKQLREQLAAKG